MKQVNFIINHLTRHPSLNKLDKIKSYKKLLKLLPINFQKGVRFMYNKNDTLFFVFEHQGYLMEFNNLERKSEYKKSFIKSLLKELIKYDKTCSCIDANYVKAFVTNKPKNILHVSTSLPIYEEKSQGKFENKTKNEKIHKLFEEIREIICSNKA